MKTGSCSDVGRTRERNEDALVVLRLPGSSQPELHLLGVADGMGGHRAGEVAAALAIDTARKWVEDHHGPRDAEGLRALLVRLFNDAEKNVLDQARRDPSLDGMGTTLTVSLICGGMVAVGHVGDSRAYLLRGDRLEFLTEDHSVAGELIREGTLSREEARSHPGRNILTRALGMQGEIEAFTGCFAVREKDWIILCSDGLTAVVSDEEIFSTVKGSAEPQEACHSLVDLANQRGGPDNITVVAAVIEEADMGDRDESEPVSERRGDIVDR
ncbi:MAG: Stp1/IreP family PP2C-type Ser/Thr phosphatase [Firmicutes bacterium]|nr:Stp1/IreP family PP2C-type Ser/Thr phosphatase [Bacillota bacterium]